MYRLNLTVEVTDGCMWGCVFCSSEAKTSNFTLLDINRFKEVVVELMPTHVNISGGEPMLNDETVGICKEIIEICSNLGIEVSMYTTFPRIARESCGDAIKLVVPFHSRWVHELMILKAPINPLLSQLEDSLENCEAHIVPTTINMHSLIDTISLAKERGISKVHILKLVVQGRASSYLEPNPDTLKKILHEVRDTFGDYVRLGDPFTGKCNAGIGKMVLLPTGKLIPCESFKGGECKCDKLLLDKVVI